MRWLNRAILSTTVCLSLTVGSCGGDEPATDKSPDQTARRGKAKGKAKARGKAKGKAEGRGKAKAKAEPDFSDQPEWEGEQPKTVIFIVLDTVRSQNTGLCGYERPNTPIMQQIEDAGASVQCDSYAAAPWTLPSHASYFTGLPVTEHGAQFVVDSDVELNAKIKVRPLGREFSTIAEHYQSEGYQTAMVSANTIIKKESGLVQGFRSSATGEQTDGSFRGDRLGQELTRLMRDRLDPDKPLFLFVNIFDAHDPYPAIPEGVGWVPERDKVRLKPNQADEDNPLFKFMRGEMDSEEAAPYLEHVTDTYDYGISIADKNVGSVMARLKRAGFLAQGYRLVLTSDHGEFLGEHHLLRHGGFLWEEVTRVPFLFYDTTLEEQPELPAPFSAINAFHLLKDGKLPDEPVPAQANAERDPDNIKVGAVSTCRWLDDDTKLVWTEGDFHSFDLEADPEEANRLAYPKNNPADAAFKQQVVDTEGLADRPISEQAGFMEALEAIGYVSSEDDGETEDDDGAEGPDDEEEEATP